LAELAQAIINNVSSVKIVELGLMLVGGHSHTKQITGALAMNTRGPLDLPPG